MAPRNPKTEPETIPPFNPLSYESLGESIISALDAQEPIPLDDLKPFYGAGIYALYYTGDFPAYNLLAEANREKPGAWALYIGRAEVENARRGEFDITAAAVGQKLYKRLMDHRKSIAKAENLDTSDFHVRRLVVDSTWVPLAEIVAIRIHQPLWNQFLAGLGNHDPGKGRSGQERSRWDTLHPGRPHALKRPARSESQAEIIQDLQQRLRMQKLG